MHVLAIRKQGINKLGIPPFVGNWLFWTAFALLLITQFSQGTMFILYYPTNSFPYQLMMLSGVIALIKVLLFNNFKDEKDLFLCITIGLLILVSCQNAGDWNLIYYYLIMLAAQNIKFDQIVRFFLIAITAGLIITFISVKFGLIMELTNSRDGDAGIRYALGMVYPTDLAARAFYLQLFYIVLKKFRLNIPEFISLMAFTFIIYIYTDTRLDFILMILTLVAALFYKQLISLIRFINVKFMLLLGLVSVAGIIILTYLYDPSNPILRIVNKLLTRRLEFGHAVFTRYNVTMFGQYIQQNGNGGIHHGWFDYFFIDCSFLRILMMNGVVVFVMVTGLLCYMMKRFMEEAAYGLVIALILAVISSLIDQHLAEISFNILFLTVYTDLNYFKESNFKLGQLNVNRK